MSQDMSKLRFNGFYFWFEPDPPSESIVLRAGTSLFLQALYESVHTQRLAAQRKKEDGAAAILLILECALLWWSDR